ncbi:MAG: hypothetical protein ACTSRS_05985 [Candidatus Helarchaeota archaeon]
MPVQDKPVSIRRKSSKKSTIHTTISKEALEILEYYLNKFTNEKKEKIYESKSAIIEHALILLHKFHNPEQNDILSLWTLFRDELDMVAVGKTTFLSYISGDTGQAYKKNIAIEILEWYKKRPISELSLEELLNAIKDVWIAANYFTKVEIEKGSQGSYQMYFFHNLRNPRYGEFWSQYFTELLEKNKSCEIEYFIRYESFILRITPMAAMN